MSKISLPEVVLAVKEEARRRRKFLPSRVKEDRLTQERADYEIEVMEKAVNILSQMNSAINS